MTDFAAASLPPILVFILVLMFAFEIWMIIEAIRNERLSDQAKVLWVVGMLLIHPIIAIFYYFFEFQKKA